MFKNFEMLSDETLVTIVGGAYLDFLKPKGSLVKCLFSLFRDCD